MFLEMASRTPVRTASTATFNGGNSIQSASIASALRAAVYRRKASVEPVRRTTSILLCKTDGDWTVMQKRPSVEHATVDLVLLDSRRCYEFDFR